MRCLKSAAVLLLSFSLVIQPVWAATFKIDPDHSSVSFKIRHLFSQTQGFFDRFSGQIEYEPGKPDTWKTEAVIETASINTRVAKRDDHLRTAEFFDAEKYPEITFKSTGVTDVTPDGAKLQGVLNMHGVEKNVVLDLKILGLGKDPWGKTRSGFTAATTLNRKDFNLTWNKAVEAGQLLLGEEVTITIEVEAIQQ